MRCVAHYAIVPLHLLCYRKSRIVSIILIHSDNPPFALSCLPMRNQVGAV